MNRLHLRKQAPAGEGGGGGSAPAWHGDFAADAAPEFKEWVGTKNYANAQAALLSAYNAEKLIGADKERTVIWPKDDADVEGWKGVRARLGVPDDAKGYELTAGQGENQAILDGVAGLFAKHNVSKSAAQAFIADIRAQNTELAKVAQTEAENAAKAERADVEREWGSAATANNELVRRFGAELGLTDEQVKAVESAIGTKAFLKAMHAGGSKLGEQKSVQGDGRGGFGVTQGDARQRIDAAREARIGGKMSESDYQAVLAQFGPIATPGTSAAA